MITYIDSSIALRIVLGEPKPLQDWSGTKGNLSSAILRVECFRALDRLRFGRRYSEDAIAERHQSLHEFIARLDFVNVSDIVLQRAAQPFPASLKTLDALHLATALLWREWQSDEVVFATHDHALGSAARLFGLAVIGL